MNQAQVITSINTTQNYSKRTHNTLINTLYFNRLNIHFQIQKLAIYIIIY